MKNKINVVLFVMVICTITQSYAQSKWHKSIGIGINTSLFSPKFITDGYPNQSLKQSHAAGLDFNANIRRDVVEKLSAGAGFAIHMMSFNEQSLITYTPIYFSVNYNILSITKTPFVFVNYGYSLPFIKNTGRGQFYSIGAGYTLNKRFKVHLQNIVQNQESVVDDNPDSKTRFKTGKVKLSNIELGVSFTL